MTIKQLLEMPVGNRTGGFNLVIKTCKKNWQGPDDIWVQQALLTDRTGDILADVKLGGYNPLIRGHLIHIIVCEIQSTDTGKKLYIDQWNKGNTASEPPGPPPFIGESVRGRIATWLLAAYLQAGHTPEETETFAESDILKKIIDSIMNA